uniref:Putative secreted peptide n=1 Tax=Anopheles braziliensis TaxID=58242 RepID=A0A2M3ZPR6_9DIPT
MGRMTASFSAALAPSSPATSDHLMFGFSITIELSSLCCSCFFSGLSESESELFLSPSPPLSRDFPSPSLTGFLLPFVPLFKYAFSFSARSRY